ncbi:MAG: hypothetical protein M3Y42_09065 [Actinomycetota bacterium]|nr:hypothetical protein [Actinomycetota bacterium]MDQ2957101.1 hypothetical protein [Actinomycetota bacterium]
MKSWPRIALAATVAIAVTLGITSASTAATRTAPVSPMVVPATAQDPQLQPETHFVPIAPCRIVDNRVAGGALHNGVTRAFYASGTVGFAPQGGKSGGCGIPAAASAIAASITAITPSGNGYLIGWANGAAQPKASVLDYFPEHGVTAGVTLAIRSGGGQSFNLKNQGPTVNVVVDATGYYIAQIQALIGSGGAILAGTSRIVSTSHPGTGSYYLTLDRPARQCAPVVTTFNLFRYASTGLSSSSTPNTISVYTWVLDATTHKEVASDYDFFISINC